MVIKMETHAQRSIKHCLDMIAPFEASNQQLEDGQAQFYHFMVSLYSGMYENPEEYLVFPEPYEEYIKKLEQQCKHARKEKEHVTDSKESTLRNTFQQAIQFYALYFYNLGLASNGTDAENGSLIIAKEDYARVISQMNRLHGSIHNVKRYELLSKLGIKITEDTDIFYIVNEKYKKAMEGVWFLCNVPDSKYKWMNFLRLDYKNAYSPIPTVGDICKTLPVESRKIVEKLEDKISSIKVKKKIKPLRGIVSDFKWKVEYCYRSKNICGFYADNSYFMLCIYFNDSKNISEFANLLCQEDTELFQWFREQFPERLCKCPSNRRVYFGDETRRICGLSNRAEVVNPNSSDLEKALCILKKYRKIED
jgi:hypothetical protein